MGARQGPDNPLSGPRLPRAPQPSDQWHEDIGDPADGEKVARCLTCGTPGPGLMSGTFVPDHSPFGDRVLRYRLCRRCLGYANGSPDPDPLTLPETAA